MIGKLAVLAVVTGSAIGATVVFADQSSPPAAKVAAVATPSGPPAGKGPSLVVTGVHQVLELPDPGGGAPWAARQFTGTSQTDKHQVFGCVELGRLLDGRFGWIDGSGTFKATTAGHGDSPLACMSAKQLHQFGGQTQRFTTVSLAEGKPPAPLETVAWGLLEPTVRRVLPAGESPIAVEDEGVFLRVEPGEVRTTTFTGMLEQADGRRVPFNPVQLPPYKGEKLVDGTQYVAARAPDPAGGLPWGLIAAKGSRGGVCLSQVDRMVGTKLGFLQQQLGIFAELPFQGFFGCRSGAPPTRGYPMRIETTISGAADSTGTIERRVVSGRVIFAGRVHRDVVSVTIHTPRDVRTFIPSGRAHAILAVYDGRFPGGKVTATARFKDGREVTRNLYSE